MATGETFLAEAGERIISVKENTVGVRECWITRVGFMASCKKMKVWVKFSCGKLCLGDAFVYRWVAKHNLTGDSAQVLAFFAAFVLKFGVARVEC